jgi:FkbM family methyltransferase
MRIGLELVMIRNIESISKKKLLTISELIVTMFYTKIYLNGYSGDAIDAGAHAGIHSRHLAFLTSVTNNKVIAVEPNPHIIPFLKKNMETELLFNFQIIENPLWHESKQVSFNIEDDAQLSHVSDINGMNVQSITLSQIFSQNASKISFIKIDVEGAGAQILRGAIDLINKHRPFIAIEIGPWDDVEDFDKLFEEYRKIGYYWVNGLGQIYSKSNWSENYENLYWNRFLVPEEAKNQIREFKKAVRPLWKSCAN